MRAVVEEPLKPTRLTAADVPPWLDEIIAVALAKSPGDRFQTASACLSAIESGVGGAPQKHCR